jgi:glyoxylase I family protein
MPMTPLTSGLHHLSLRTTDLARVKRFYTETMGFQLLREDRFDPFRVGLDHLALGVANADSLYELKQQLDAAGVRNNGVQDDAVTGAS